MDDIIDLKADSERATLALCRELLGDEAEELSDEQHDVAGIGWWLAHLKNLVADYRPVLHDCRKRCGATGSPISALLSIPIAMRLAKWFER